MPRQLPIGCAPIAPCSVDGGKSEVLRTCAIARFFGFEGCELESSSDKSIELPNSPLLKSNSSRLPKADRSRLNSERNSVLAVIRLLACFLTTGKRGIEEDDMREQSFSNGSWPHGRTTKDNLSLGEASKPNGTAGVGDVVGLDCGRLCDFNSRNGKIAVAASFRGSPSGKSSPSVRGGLTARGDFWTSAGLCVCARGEV